MKNISGVGLGLRMEFLDELLSRSSQPVNFLEIAPENWIGVGGWRKKKLQAYCQQYPMTCHGLSLSIGGPNPLDKNYLSALKQFLDQYEITLFSDHLTYCGDQQGLLYDLLPLPFTNEAVAHVVNRVCQVQDILGQQIALENASFYAQLPGEMTEVEFITQVIQQADCKLLLDVNNVYVNAQNHQNDPIHFIEQIPTNRIAYLHIAGHERRDNQLIIDTHGADVCEDVWSLLRKTYQTHGVLPTLLERDNDIPALQDLLQEIELIKRLQS